LIYSKILAKQTIYLVAKEVRNLAVPSQHLVKLPSLEGYPKDEEPIFDYDQRHHLSQFDTEESMQFDLLLQ